MKIRGKFSAVYFVVLDLSYVLSLTGLGVWIVSSARFTVALFISTWRSHSIKGSTNNFERGLTWRFVFLESSIGVK